MAPRRVSLSPYLPTGQVISARPPPPALPSEGKREPHPLHPQPEREAPLTGLSRPHSTSCDEEVSTTLVGTWIA